MKKILGIAVALALIPMFTQAQGIGLGIKAGANFANQNVKDISTKTITGFHAGAYLNLNLTDKFGITPEVLYSAVGSKWEDSKLNTDYISIPVMLRIKPIKLISIEAGPQFSLLTKAHLQNFGDFKDNIKSNDFGLAFGAGLHLPMNINAGVRYVLGFTNISDVSGNSAKNRTFQIYVGYTLFGKS